MRPYHRESVKFVMRVTRSVRLWFPELRQLLLVTLHEFLVHTIVRVIPHRADSVPPEPEHCAGALVHHVRRVALEPGALADLDDHALVGVVPVAPHVLVTPVRRPQARLAAVEAADYGRPPPPLAPDRRRPRHPIRDVLREVTAHLVHLPGEQRLLVRLRDPHPLAHTVVSSISSGSGRVLALRPARSIGLSISALWRSMIVQKSIARSSSSYAASRSCSLARPRRTLFSMSSASQPRECAMNGNGGKTNPSSAQKVNKLPATAWMLSCPPVMMNAATLFLISIWLWIVTWFCTQFSRSIIL